MIKDVNECLTSSAVTGSPLLNFAWACNVKVMDKRSEASCMSSANKPYIVATSSVELIASVSNIRLLRPAAVTPLSEKGLNLSKLVRESGLAKYNSPPLGALGFKYSKWVKPA